MTDEKYQSNLQLTQIFLNFIQVGVTGITAGSSLGINLIDTPLTEDGVNRTTAILFEGGTKADLKHVTQAIIQRFTIFNKLK